MIEQLCDEIIDNANHLRAKTRLCAKVSGREISVLDFYTKELVYLDEFKESEDLPGYFVGGEYVPKEEYSKTILKLYTFLMSIEGSVSCINMECLDGKFSPNGKLSYETHDKNTQFFDYQNI